MTLTLSDDNSVLTVELGDDVEDLESKARDQAAEWVGEGEWESDGGSVRVRWSVTDDGDEIADGFVDVELDVDHAALIRAAGGDPDCKHDWTREGEGGLAVNPGVSRTEGNGLSVAEHCRQCGLSRVHRVPGPRTNAGEAETWTYSQPDQWCSDCEREDCECDPSQGEED